MVLHRLERLIESIRHHYHYSIVLSHHYNNYTIYQLGNNRLLYLYFLQLLVLLKMLDLLKIVYLRYKFVYHVDIFCKIDLVTKNLVKFEFYLK